MLAPYAASTACIPHCQTLLLRHNKRRSFEAAAAAAAVPLQARPGRSCCRTDSMRGSRAALLLQGQPASIKGAWLHGCLRNASGSGATDAAWRA